MKDVINKNLNIRNRNIIAIVIIILGIAFLVNYSFFEPTYINEYIATNVYDTPANSYFEDDNFYKCVVDIYNSENRTSLPYTTNLSDEELQTITILSCSNKNITSVKGLEKLTVLEYLDIHNNQLTSLDVSKNMALTDLYVNDNQLTSLDVSKNTVLEDLRAYKNQLISLDVSNNSVLTELLVYNNQLTSLDVSKNMELKKLLIGRNYLTSLDVSKNTVLTELDVRNNQLSKLDVGNNTALIKLYADNNQLTNLKLIDAAKLGELFVSNNQLTSLNVSGATALTELQVYNNQLTSLDISGATAMTELQAYNNQLTSLDISNNEKLKRLELYNNFLTNLDVTEHESLEYLSIKNNKLTSLMLGGNINLLELYLSEVFLASSSTFNGITYLPENKLVSIDISEAKALKKFYANKCQLTSLDVGNNTALTELDVRINQLSELDVSNNTALTLLSVDNNQLTSLDVSKNVALTDLSVSLNQLTSLDLSNNTSLVSSRTNIRNNPYSETLYVYKNNAIIVDTNVKVPSQLNWGSPTWTSKDTSIATVDQNGMVKALKLGSVDISGKLSTNAYTINTTSTINVIEITSDNYEIDEDNNYIFVGSEKDIDVIKSNINISDDNIKIDINSDNYILQVKYNEEVLKEFDIIGYGSEVYDLNKDYIYMGHNDLGKIYTINCTKEILDNKLFIKHGDQILKKYDLISISSDAYELSDKYIYLGISEFNIEKIKTINCTKEILDNKLLIKYNDTIIFEYDLVSVSSDTYDLTREYIYLGTNKFNLENITCINCTKDVKGNKLLIKYNDIVLNEYKLISVSSDTYDLSNDYIYVVAGSIDINNIAVINGTVTVDSNKLLIKNNDDVVFQYDLIGFKINNYNILGNKIMLKNKIKYDEFISNIEISGNISYKLFNGEKQIINGDVSGECILKIYYNNNVIDEYIVTDEYLEFDESLDIDEDNTIINNVSVGTNINSIKNKINTSGNISVFDKDDNVITNTTANIRTGDKFKIEFSRQTLYYIVSVRGDINGDGQVNINDIIGISKHVVKGNVISGTEYINASDVNDNGNIEINDVIKLAKHIIKDTEL